MVRVAWLGKKSPFCGNVSYGNLTTEQLKMRGHKVSFINLGLNLHFLVVDLKSKYYDTASMTEIRKLIM